MQWSDIEQAAAIEKDAFPELFPPTSFPRELKRKRSTNLVAELNKSHPNYVDFLPLNKTGSVNLNLYRNGYTGWHEEQKFIAGFIVVWEMAGEAHVVSIAVRRNFRRRGIGELLLLSSISSCIENGLNSVTLEVRLSNCPAQALYKKYGFTIEGVRKGYYSDTREDALIMTLDVTSPENVTRLQTLSQIFTSDPW